MITLQAFLPCVESALIARGNDVEQVLDACRALLGELESKEASVKNGKIGGSKGLFKTSTIRTTKYEGRESAPLLFVRWEARLVDAWKVAEIDEIGIPRVFHFWLDAMIAKAREVAEKAAKAKEAAEKEAKAKFDAEAKAKASQVPAEKAA